MPRHVSANLQFELGPSISIIMGDTGGRGLELNSMRAGHQQRKIKEGHNAIIATISHSFYSIVLRARFDANKAGQNGGKT